VAAEVDPVDRPVPEPLVRGDLSARQTRGSTSAPAHCRERTERESRGRYVGPRSWVVGGG
jgi:hypothetical protein